MPHGIFVIKWDNIVGPSIEVTYPDSIEIPMDIVLNMYNTHVLSHQANEFLVMKLPDSVTLSYNIGREYVIGLLLQKNEDDRAFRPLLKDTAEKLYSLKDGQVYQQYISKWFEDLQEERLPSYIFQALDLSPQEIRVYLSLVDEGIVDIKQIAYIIGSRTKEIRRISSRLVSLGLLTRIEGEEEKYRAVPPYTALISQIQDLETVLQQKIRDIPAKISQEFQKLKESLHLDFSTEVETLMKENATGTQISEAVGAKFEKNLKYTGSDFLNRITPIFLNEMSDATNKLNAYQKTLNSLWEWSRQRSTVVYKEVWFVKSKQVLRTYIESFLERAKSNVLIIAPKWSDLSQSFLKKILPHVRIRIATEINMRRQKCRDFVEKLQEYPNITLRHYGGADLWGIQRDQEELILGAQLETEGLLAIGTRIHSQIRLFLPVLENVWLTSTPHKNNTFDH
ncbi:MAG: helix-turn-helix domain-containing protein [Candidatus Ranarchaeia archaeon]